MKKNITDQSRGRAQLMAGRWLAMVVPAVLIAVTPSVASAESTPPQLSIQVDNGRTSAHAGEKLSYTITITNQGTRKLTGLIVTQSLPSGSTLVSANSDGVAHRDSVRWKLNLEAVKTATLRSTIAVPASTPPELLRLAIVACAATSAQGPPIVCASDSDELPAGAARAQLDRVPAPTSAVGPHTWWYIGGGIVALVAITVAATVLLRRRRAAA